MDALNEVLKWAKKLPDWQSDALRRLWTQETFSDNDKKEIETLLLSEHGIQPRDEKEKVTAERFGFEHVSILSSQNETVTLEAMHGLRGVNALAPDQRLAFGSKGLTVVYGENAAGKSGYSRILKRACRARGAADTIYPDLTKVGEPLEAEATFQVKMPGEDSKTVTWRDLGPKPDCLSDIAVFDSKCARVYVDEEDEVAYRPYGLDVLGDLADVCDRIRDRLKNQVAMYGAAPPGFAEFVGENKLLPTLNADTPPKTVRELARFTPEDRQTLSKLEKHVAELVANSPVEKAGRYRALRNRINTLRRNLLNLKSALSVSSIGRLRGLLAETREAKRTRDMASRNDLGGKVLTGTGGDAWHRMFTAARQFSEEDAYRGQAFPVTSEGSRCVLCQQVLDSSAKDRMQRFWRFILTETSRHAEIADRAFAKTRTEIEDLDSSDSLIDPDLLAELERISSDPGQSLRDLLASARKRRDFVIRACGTGDWGTLPDLDSTSFRLLSKLAKGLAASAAECDLLDTSQEKQKSESRLSRLKQRQLLVVNLDSVLNYIQNEDRKRKLDSCIKAANTLDITTTQRDLTERATSGRLEETLEEEFKNLGVNYLPLRITTRGRKGRTCQKLRLKNVAYHKVAHRLS